MQIFAKSKDGSSQTVDTETVFPRITYEIVLYSRNDLCKDELSRSNTKSGKFILSPNSFPPSGDQPIAIAKLSYGALEKSGCQTLLGVTGSG